MHNCCFNRNSFFVCCGSNFDIEAVNKNTLAASENPNTARLFF